VLPKVELEKILKAKFQDFVKKKINELDSVELVTLIADVEELLKENEINKSLMNDEFLSDINDEVILLRIINYIYE
jgi:hypothetical protein